MRCLVIKMFEHRAGDPCAMLISREELPFTEGSGRASWTHYVAVHGQDIQRFVDTDGGVDNILVMAFNLLGTELYGVKTYRPHTIQIDLPLKD